MAKATGNSFVRALRKIYNPIGFHKGYNFPLWIIFSGALLGFALARFNYLDIAGVFAKKAAPGEWFWYKSGYRRVGITLHLAAVMPCSVLAVFQFVPVIRHKLLLLHRIDGYIIMFLVGCSNVGALLIARRAFGGDMAVQIAVGLLATGTTFSTALAYYNIKRLQIDQHRAWMLRTWFYMGAIVSLRIIQAAAVRIVTNMGTYYSFYTCDEITSMYGSPNITIHFYPLCADPSQLQDDAVVVHADIDSGLPEQIGAAYRASFGLCVWLALILHAVGIELYLNLTPAESHRLRVVSYERQVEAGFRNAGSAGLTVDRIGDAPKWRAAQPLDDISAPSLYAPVARRDDDRDAILLGASAQIR